MYKRKIGVPSRNHHWRGKTISIAYSEYVSVVLGIQHVRLIIFSSVACLVVPDFITISHENGAAAG